MKISCEKCSTTYVLDDALVPPQGAPVQCTRCGHVFTARLPPPEAAAPEALPAPVWESPELAQRPASSTLVFGAATGGKPPTAAPAPNQTMVFGTPAFQGKGGPGGPPVPLPNQTMVFGTPAVSQAPAGAGGGASAGNRTVIFGVPGAGGARPPAASPPSSPANQTMVFGAPAVPPEEAQSGKNQTMMFGRAPGKAIPKVTVGAAEAGGYAALTGGPPSEATIQVDLEALKAGQPAAAPEARQNRTALFAMNPSPAAPPPSEEPQNRTVLFAMNPGVPTPLPPEEPQNRTVLFAMPPAPAVAPAQAHPAQAHPAGAGQTMVFGGHLAAEAARAPAHDRSSSPTAPELPTLDGPSSLELPPDEGHHGAVAPPAGDDAADEAALAAMRAAAGRRTTVAVIIFLVLALALAAALAWYLFGKALVGGGAAAIEAQARDAVALLRRDDDDAHAESIARSRSILEKAPDSVEARSALVLATALTADDASARARRDQHDVDALRRRLERLSDRSPSREDLARRLERAQQAWSKSTREAEALQASLKQETQALLQVAQARNLPTAQQLAALRARSVSLAVQGEATSLMLAEEFNQKSGLRDNWADMALPEYVANGGASFDDALRQLETVQVRDDTFLRAYVLSARISLLREDAQGAETQLAKVLAFHPGHDMARQLMAWVRSHRERD